MVTHYHGQNWNGAEIARSLSVSEPTVRRYLDALTDTLVLRQLQPWHANVRKRQVRSPKVYVRDPRSAPPSPRHRRPPGLLSHPKLGASWEGFVIEQFLARTGIRDAWFWGTHGGAEIDLLVQHDGRWVGVEVKRTDAPHMTPSIRNAIEDLDLDRVIVAHAGEVRFPITPNVEAIGAAELLTHGIT